LFCLNLQLFTKQASVVMQEVDLHSRGHALSGHGCITAVGKLFTPLYSCHQAV